jgi:NAD(P)H-dependent flavin oxidoreductase YrpB (nitropropane dioxygenase family)
MITTAFTRLLGIEHPVVSAGMGAGISDGELAGRVSEAGGLGVIGASWLQPDAVREMVAHARSITASPIGINLLLFGAEQALEAVLETGPEVLSTAWPRDDQDLAAVFARAHERAAKVMHMVTTLEDAPRAVEAGADVIVAQGTEGGGHVGEMATTVLVRQVVEAVAPVPVLAAGGLADGAGLAGALAMGADGVLLGTRFLASDECPIPAWLKQEIVASDGHDTVRTTVPDTLTGRDWPGAWARVFRTQLIERWIGREPELRRRRKDVMAVFEALDGTDKPEDWFFWIGQSAGLIDDVRPAGEIVREIVADAEEILRSRLPRLLGP